MAEAPSTRPESPYLDALRAYADRNPGRFHVPGHKGGAAADELVVEAFGEQALRMDIPALTQGIDAGPSPTPFQQAQQLAAEAWGALLPKTLTSISRALMPGSTNTRRS